MAFSSLLAATLNLASEKLVLGKNDFGILIFTKSSPNTSL